MSLIEEIDEKVKRPKRCKKQKQIEKKNTPQILMGASSSRRIG
jgi:hypothetical protein